VHQPNPRIIFFPLFLHEHGRAKGDGNKEIKVSMGEAHASGGGKSCVWKGSGIARIFFSVAAAFSSSVIIMTTTPSTTDECKKMPFLYLIWVCVRSCFHPPRTCTCTLFHSRACLPLSRHKWIFRFPLADGMRSVHSLNENNRHTHTHNAPRNRVLQFFIFSFFMLQVLMAFGVECEGKIMILMMVMVMFWVCHEKIKKIIKKFS
jgi:hypothetical protein